MRGGIALHRQRPFGGNENAWLLARNVGTEKLVKGLEHEGSAKLDDCTKYVDSSTFMAFKACADT